MSTAKPGFGQILKKIWRRPAPVDQIAEADRRLVLGLSRSRIPTWRQLRYLPLVLQPADIRWLKFFGALTVLAVGLLAVNTGWANIHRVPQRGGTLTEGVIGPPQYINPVLAGASNVDTELTHFVYRGLMKVDADFRLTFDLAQSVDISADGKTYTIKLRPNLRWSDGQPLLASDAQYTFETIADPEYHSPLAALFQGVKFEAPDERTIIFRLAEPLAPFLSYLTVGLLPQRAWLDSTPQTFHLAELNTKPTISNGPYKFSSLTKDRTGSIRSYTFVRNQHFAGRPPMIDKVVVKFYPDYASGLAALDQGSIDALGGLDLADRAAVSKSRTITPFAVSQLTGVFLNQRNPALKAKEVRVALATAVNRPDLIARILTGNTQAIHGPILPGYFGYNQNLRQRPFDLAAAEKILDDNGWKKNDQGVRQKDKQQLTFTFTVINNQTLVAVAEQLIANWQKIGANVELKKIEASRIQKDVIRPRNYEALLFGQIFGTDPDPYPFWHSSQNRDTGFNLAIFISKKVDEDVAKGRVEPDPKQRATYYFDFQNVVAEEVPAIFLYQHQYLYAHQKSLRGIDNLRVVSGHDRFLGIEYWYLKTRLAWQAKK